MCLTFSDILYYYTFKMYRFFLAFTAVAFIVFNLKAQQNYPQDYFRPPLDIPLLISGSFGELRNNHFHGGLDIKTQNIEGKSVYAIADGYVSRIKVSGAGYGKALYITHPNGYVSVYGHLRNFSDTIEKYLVSEQLKAESFEVELYPDKNILPVIKGDTVAFGGNTGSSGGPHLHFEIRDTLENGYNPLLFGFEVKDVTPPVITELVLFPLNQNSFVNRSNMAKFIPLTGLNGNYKFKVPTPLELYGDIGFAILSYDVMNTFAHRNGTYSVDVLLDSLMIYHHEMDMVPVKDTRALNSMIDYLTYKKKHVFYQRLFKEPNNTLPVYKTLVNRGVISLKDDTTHTVRINVKDYTGNASNLSFKVKSNPFLPIKTDDTFSPFFQQEFNYKTENIFKNEHLIAEFPAGVFYDNIPFHYRITDTIKGALTATHVLHNEFVPVHDYYNLTFNIGCVPTALREKILVVNRESSGRTVPLSGGVKGDLITAKARSLGAFTVMIDTTPPVITPVNIPLNGNISLLNYLRFTIGDNLSGIGSHKAYIDGRFIIMEHDQKTASITYWLDKSLEKGSHELRLVVTDKRGNVKEYKKMIYR